VGFVLKLILVIKLSSEFCVVRCWIFLDLGIAFFRFLLNCIFTMPRQGSRPRKRKFRGNQLLHSAKKPRVVDSVNNDTTELSEQSTSTEADHTVSASARKIGTQNPQFGTQSKPNVTGYRFIDMELLGELFTQMV
jgi:hypothetical protein